MASTSTSTPTSAADIGGSISPNDEASTTPAPTTAAKQGAPPSYRPGCKCVDGGDGGGSDNVRMQSQSVDDHTPPMSFADMQKWLEAVTARQERELGEMRAELEAVKAERENDRRHNQALLHRVVALENEGRESDQTDPTVYLDMVEFRASMQGVASSVVRSPRPA